MTVSSGVADVPFWERRRRWLSCAPTMSGWRSLIADDLYELVMKVRA
ncbi:MAG: hypothetical protein OXB92_00160 [Acidimicrobiaceae bacterium]|nr:hypothetical protein [Acidimicrobiaceae bacterium]